MEKTMLPPQIERFLAAQREKGLGAGQRLPPVPAGAGERETGERPRFEGAGDGCRGIAQRHPAGGGGHGRGGPRAGPGLGHRAADPGDGGGKNRRNGRRLRRPSGGIGEYHQKVTLRRKDFLQFS